MVDIWDEKTRSNLMSRVRNRDTHPEVALRSALFAAGIRGYRLHRKDIPGTPDLVWLSLKVAIFVDGAFWHGHPSAFKPGQSGRFWDEKIRQNMQRDERTNEQLSRDGWHVLRFWDFEINQSIQDCVERVASVLAGSRQS